MSAQGKFSGLLQWVKNKTKDYDNISVSNFSQSWSNGLAFCAIIHHYHPDLIDYSSLKAEDAEKNLKLAWDIAENKLHIENYLDYEDILAVSRPEPKTMTMQVYEYYKHFSQKEPNTLFNSAAYRPVKTEPTSAFTKTLPSTPAKPTTTATTTTASKPTYTTTTTTSPAVVKTPTPTTTTTSPSSVVTTTTTTAPKPTTTARTGSIASRIASYTNATTSTGSSSPTTTTTPTTSTTPTTTTTSTTPTPTTTTTKKLFPWSKSSTTTTTTASATTSSPSPTTTTTTTSTTSKPTYTTTSSPTTTTSTASVSKPTYTTTTSTPTTTTSTTTKPTTTSTTTSSTTVSSPTTTTDSKPTYTTTSVSRTPTTTNTTTTTAAAAVTATVAKTIVNKAQEIDTEKLEREIAELKRELEKAKQLNEFLKKSNESTSQQLTTEISQWKSKSQQLETSLQSVKNELNEQKTKATSASSSLSQQSSQLKLEKERVEKQYNEAKTQNQKLERDVSESRSLAAKLDNEKKLIESKIVTLENDKKKVQKDYDDLMKIMNSNKNTDQKSQDQIRTLEEQLKRIQGEKSDLQRERDRLKDELALNKLNSSENEKRSASQIRTLQSDLSQLKTEKTGLEKRLFDREKEITNASQQVRKMTVMSAESSQSIEARDMERWVIDQVILFAQPTYVTMSGTDKKDQKIPLAAKMLFLSLRNWISTSFSKNVVSALKYSIQKHCTDRIMLAYWINTLIRLLSLLSKEYKQQTLVSKSLLESKNSSTILSMDNDKYCNDKYYIAPPAMTATSSSSILLLIPELASLLDLSYMCMLKTLMIKLDAVVHNSMFDAYDLGDAYDGEAAMDKITLELDTVLDELQHEFHVDQRIVLHFFACVGRLLDVMIFNNCIAYHKKLTMNEGIQLKMNISFLEAWFFESKLTMGENITALFSYSRQIADVCVLSQDSLATDKVMREMVCPDLTTQQISYILANKKINNVTPFYCKYTVSFKGYTDPSTWSHIDNQPVFMFEDSGRVLEIEIPAQLIRKDIKFLQEENVF